MSEAPEGVVESLSAAADDDNPQALKQQIQDLQTQVSQLKSQLLAKEHELEAVRQGAKVSPTDAVKTEQMKNLQERLSQLKRDQAEANQTRDTAWKHLKETVQDLAKLVNHNDLNPLQASVNTAIWKKPEPEQ
jgi:predicted RNase H-like nuclease (RuvC/YqgF family)